MDENKFFRVFGASFGSIGIILIIIALICGLPGLGLAPGKVKTTAEVTNIGGGHTSIQYEVKGRTYRDSMSMTVSSIRIGDEITIYVNPDEPNDYICVISRVLVLCICGGIGAVFAIIGSVFFFIGRGRNKVIRQVRAGGRTVQAEIDRIEWNYSTTVNGRNPIKIYCSYDNGMGTVYKFASDNIWDDPGFDWNEEKKEKVYVTVYVDPSDMKKYYVDPDTVPRAEKKVEYLY